MEGQHDALDAEAHRMVMQQQEQEVWSAISGNKRSHVESESTDHAAPGQSAAELKVQSCASHHVSHVVIVDAQLLQEHVMFGALCDHPSLPNL